MKLSIHETIRGKPPKGQPVNLGYGWVNIEAEWPDVFELITRDGVATSAELSSDNRKEANFVSRELIMVDIDSGMTIEQLFANDFYNEFGAGFYTTPSHSEQRDRFRIMFRLATPATDPARLRKINRALLKIFAEADEACKDSTRIFYGCINSQFCERTDRLLTDEMADQLVALTEAKDAEVAAEMTTTPRDYAPLTDAARQHIINLLHKSFVGQYDIWRNIGWGLKAGGFSLADYQYVTTGMMNQKSAADAATVWRDGGVDGKISMGTVVHFLKQRHGADCLNVLAIRETHQQALAREIEMLEKEIERRKLNAK